MSKVTQEDREAAVGWGGWDDPSAVLSGRLDNHVIIQRLAAHREKSIALERAAIANWLYQARDVGPQLRHEIIQGHHLTKAGE